VGLQRHRIASTCRRGLR